MASSTRWTWVWARSRRWLRTEKPGMLQSMVSQRVRHDWATEQEQHTPILKLTLNFSNGSKIFHFTIGNSVLKGNTLRKDNRLAVIHMEVQMTLLSVVCGQDSWRKKKGQHNETVNSKQGPGYGPGFLFAWLLACLGVEGVIFYFNKSFILIEVQLLYNVVLVSAVQQCESAVCIHRSHLSWTSLPLPYPPL